MKTRLGKLADVAERLGAKVTPVYPPGTKDVVDLPGTPGEAEFTAEEIKVIHLRADLNDAVGKHRKMLRDFQYDLGVALVALQRGKSDVTVERITRILEQINAVLENF